MSRIGKSPITIPSGVEVTIAQGNVTVKGSKGTLSRPIPGAIIVRKEESTIFVERPNDERDNRALHGLTRTLVANMVEGVLKGFEKRLRIEGIGYQAKMDKKAVELTVGFANKIKVQPPEGVTVEVPEPTVVLVKGADKQMVGQFAADVRAVRPPEPYKGKGIRYDYEIVRRKEGKAFGSGG